jgi:hypothetical protein
MPNDQRNRKNQPPTGQGKHQPRRGDPDKLNKRSEVVQAQRGHPELNLGDDTAEDARAGNSEEPPRPPRKAGR